jgi:hypothetical protein
MLVCYTTLRIYVGATIDYERRFIQHETAYEKYLKTGSFKCSSSLVLAGNNYKMLILEYCNCETSSELYRIEGIYIRNYMYFCKENPLFICVNAIIPKRTYEERYKDIYNGIKGCSIGQCFYNIKILEKRILMLEKCDKNEKIINELNEIHEIINKQKELNKQKISSKRIKHYKKHPNKIIIVEIDDKIHNNDTIQNNNTIQNKDEDKQKTLRRTINYQRKMLNKNIYFDFDFDSEIDFDDAFNKVFRS